MSTITATFSGTEVTSSVLLEDHVVVSARERRNVCAQERRSVGARARVAGKGRGRGRAGGGTAVAADAAVPARDAATHQAAPDSVR